MPKIAVPTFAQQDNCIFIFSLESCLQPLTGSGEAPFNVALECIVIHLLPGYNTFWSDIGGRKEPQHNQVAGSPQNAVVSLHKSRRVYFQHFPVLPYLF